MKLLRFYCENEKVYKSIPFVKEVEGKENLVSLEVVDYDGEYFIKESGEKSIDFSGRKSITAVVNNVNYIVTREEIGLIEKVVEVIPVEEQSFSNVARSILSGVTLRDGL